MRLEAGCEITFDVGAATPMLLMLRPRSGYGQWVAREEYTLTPHVPVIEFTDTHGNLFHLVVTPAAGLHIKTEVEIEVTDSIAVHRGGPRTRADLLPDYALQFMLPSRYCPSDTLEQLAKDVTAGMTPGYDQVEAIRAWIRKSITYKYGVSTGSTSAADTLRDRAGVCRDFSHVGLSLCRALRIPARMVVGYLYQLDPMDLHAWFEAFIDGRWFTFDATQKEPRGGRVAIAYGRDAADVALITNFGPMTTSDLRVWVEEQ